MTRSLIGSLILSALPASQANPNQMVAHFIDVGQGDATLLEFSCSAILIDMGCECTDEVSDRERLARYLRDSSISRTDNYYNRGARMFDVNENNDLAAGDNAGGGR